MYLSPLKFFWRVTDVKSIIQVINLSFHPVTLCTHLSCWPLEFIFFKIRLLFLLSSFSSVSWALSHLVSITFPCRPCLNPLHVSLQWDTMSFQLWRVSTTSLGVQPISLTAWIVTLAFSRSSCSPSNSTLLRIISLLKSKGDCVPSLCCTNTLFILMQFEFWLHLFLDLPWNFILSRVFMLYCLFRMYPMSKAPPKCYSIPIILSQDAPSSQVQRSSSLLCFYSCCLFSVLAFGPCCLVLSLEWSIASLDDAFFERTVLQIFLCSLICT